MNDLFDVSGKTALVTGGSRGIGLMIARGLVQAGARVIVSSRKSDDVTAAARTLSEHGECEAIPGDISTPEGAAELAAATRDDPARVINIGTIDGIRTPVVENYSYSASKAAVHMLTRHLAKRLASDHITVNAIAPGPFESKMMAFLLEDPESREMVEENVPLGRIGRPDDVAGLTLFLASRAGSYMTGAVIPLDGGITGCG
jgi:NAD(P)-dependent dehydrogenase (short-subunit alcohol dehydrogenase family)